MAAAPRFLIVENPAQLGRRAAAIVGALLKKKPAAVLMIPTGSTPLPMYEELVRKKTDFSRARVFLPDEYVGGRDYLAYIRRVLVHRLPKSRRPLRVDAPDGRAKNLRAEAAAYERKILRAGGVDLAVWGLGRNGHFGFNEPGTPPGARTRVVRLTPSTLRANADARAKGRRRALTVGPATARDMRAHLLLVSGAHKAAALARFRRGDPPSRVPAAALKTAGRLTVIADRAAAGRRPRARG
ncbi:MAG: glucosamine-6-phosphate deaminase [Elusimicrobiota bacterium]